MGFVKWKSTTKVEVSVKDLEALKEHFLDIKAIMDLEDIRYPTWAYPQLGSDHYQEYSGHYQLCACLKLDIGKTRV